MVSRKLDFPVFDADNHMYETPDALTKHLAAEYKGVIEYIEITGRTKIMVKGQISEYIPNPTFERGGPPGRAGGVLQERQPRGQVAAARSSARRSTAPAAFREPGPRARAHGRARHRPRDDVADAGEPGRGAPARRPERHPRRHPRPQPVDARAVDVQLRGPHLPDAGHHAADRRAGHRGARVGASSAARAIVLVRPAPVPALSGTRSFALPEFDPFWELVRRGRRRGRHARLRQRLPALHQRVGGRRRRVPAVQGRTALREVDHRPPGDQGHHGRGGLPRRLHPASPTSRSPGRERQLASCRPCSTHSSRPTGSCRSCSRRTRSRCSSATSRSTRSTRRTLGLIDLPRRRPRALRLRLPAPRGHVRPDHLRRRARGAAARTTTRKIMGGNMRRLMGATVPA